MVPAYRAEAALFGHDVAPVKPSSEVPLSQIADVRRAQVSIESSAAAMIRSLGEPPSRKASDALRAFEAKIQLEREAVAEATHGRRSAFELAMRETVPPAVNAREAFADVGASTCSGLM